MFDISQWTHFPLTKNPEIFINDAKHFKSLWPSDDIRCQRSWSALVQIMACPLLATKWVGYDVFFKVVVTFSHVGGSFDHFSTTNEDVWIMPSFWICSYVLHVEHISCVITNSDQHQRVITFSSLNSPLGLAGGKYHKKITIPFFRLVNWSKSFHLQWQVNLMGGLIFVVLS